MAEPFLGSIADSTIEHLTHLFSQERGQLCGVGHGLRKLHNTFSTIRAMLHEAERRPSVFEDVKDWLKKLKDVVYDADDLLDDFSTETLYRQRVTEGGKRALKLDEVRTFFSSSNQILYSYIMADQIEDIRKRIGAIMNGRVHFELRGSTSVGPWSMEENQVRPETYPFEYKPYVVGRDKDKKEVIDFLLDPNFEENVTILPIVGLGGMGKTTLARFVFNDECVKECFMLRLWVCVSTNFRVKDILRKIALQCIQDKEKLANLEMNELQKMLGEELDGKSFLLVLDDMWNENRFEWWELQQFLMHGAKGSKVLVTTRSLPVADTMAATVHELSGLSDDESLLLLMLTAMKQEHELRDQNLEIIAKEILMKCAGNPLAIMTIGRLLLLSGNMEEDWLDFKNKDLWQIAQDKFDIIPSLKLDYDFLPSSLKWCFAYCSLFPKDYELDPSELIDLWMAHGFIKSVGKTQKFEIAGEDEFLELVSKSFFHDLKKDIYGNIIGCKMHTLMHDLAKFVARDSCITIDSPHIRELPVGAYHVFVSTIDMEDYELAEFERNRRIRSLFLNVGDKISHMDISCFRNIRALRLHDANTEVISNLIPKLKLLRCLNLSENHELRSLPNSISRLCKLQTLNLRECYNLERLPQGITKLVSLRKLNVYRCDKLPYMPREMEKLADLQMLGKFVVGEEGNRKAARLNELNRLIRLGENLMIDHLERLENISSEVDASFSMEMHALQSLELRWEYADQEEYGANDEEVLEMLRPHPAIKGLVIEGYGGIRLSSWVSELHYLVKIEISCCNECTHLPPLDQLTYLKVISLNKLRELECIELSESWTSKQSLFPSLEVLELKYLPNFRGWERRNSNVEENIQNEEEEGSPLCVLQTSSHKVTVTIEYCPRFSFIQSQQLHLGWTTNKILQQLLRNTNQEVPDPSMMKFIYVSSISLSKLTSLSLCGMKDMKHLPMELFQSLPSLRSFVIRHCPRLKSLCIREILQYLIALERLEIGDLALLDLSMDDNDGDDSGEGMHDLQMHGHLKLRHLKIKGIKKMEPFPGCLQYLPNLEALEISFCFSLKSLAGSFLRLVTSLESLVLKFCPELDLTGQPENQEDSLNLQSGGPTKLRELELREIVKMKTLPWWIHHLTNLESLKLFGCCYLEALPEWFPQLPLLKSLTVVDCEELSRRCKGNIGEDWPKISHIQHVHISDDNK